MRLLILFTFCFVCSCTYLEGVIQGAPSVADKQSADEDNSTKAQSKQGAIRSSGYGEQEQTDWGAGTQASDITADIKWQQLAGRLKAADNAKAHSSSVSHIFKLVKEDQTFVITAGPEGDLILWKFAGQTLTGKKILQMIPGFTSLALDPRNLLFAASYADGVTIYELTSGKTLTSTSRIATRVIDMDFSPVDQSLMLGGADGVVYRWQFGLEKIAQGIAEREKIIERYIGHSSVVNLVRLHPFGRVFLSAGWGGAINAWLLYSEDRYEGRFDQNIFGGRFFSETVNRIRAGRVAISIIEQMVFSADGQFFYTADEAGTIDIWKMRGFSLAYSHVLAHKGKIYDLCLAPSQTELFSLGRDGKLRKWRIKSEPSKFPGINDYSIELIKEVDSPDSRKLVCVGNDLVALSGLATAPQIMEIKD